MAKDPDPFLAHERDEGLLERGPDVPSAFIPSLERLPVVRLECLPIFVEQFPLLGRGPVEKAMDFLLLRFEEVESPCNPAGRHIQGLGSEIASPALVGALSADAAVFFSVPLSRCRMVALVDACGALRAVRPFGAHRLAGDQRTGRTAHGGCAQAKESEADPLVHYSVPTPVPSWGSGVA